MINKRDCCKIDGLEKRLFPKHDFELLKNEYIPEDVELRNEEED